MSAKGQPANQEHDGIQEGSDWKRAREKGIVRVVGQTFYERTKIAASRVLLPFNGGVTTPTTLDRSAFNLRPHAFRDQTFFGSFEDSQAIFL